MVSINRVKRIVDFILDKEQSGEYSIEQFNEACQMANLDLFRIRYGLTEEYMPDSPRQRVAYEVTQKVKDDMRVFKKTATIPRANGVFPLPVDYTHTTSILSASIDNCDGSSDLGKKVELVTDGEIGARMCDFLTKPSEKNPIGSIEAEAIRVYPATISAISLTYLKTPDTPVWAYTIQSDVAIYDADNSVNFEWPDILANDLSRLVLSYMGVSLRDDAVRSYARESVQTGK